MMNKHDFVAVLLRINLMIRSTFVAACLFFFLVFISNETKAQKKKYFITSSQALEDIRWLTDFIYDVHIDPFALIDEHEFNQHIHELIEDIQNMEQISRFQFYSKIVPLVYSINDIHISLELPFRLNDYYKSRNYFLDISVALIDNNLYAFNIDNETKNLWSRVKSINQISDTAIISLLQKHSVSEGYNLFTKNAYIQCYFKYLLPQVMEIFKVNTIEHSPFNTQTTVSSIVEATTQLQPHVCEGNNPISNYYNITFYDSIETAFIKISSFGHETNEIFNDFLIFVFDQVHQRGVKHLILDMRNNQGGYADRGEVLLSYLISHETPYIHNIVFKRSKLADDIYNHQSKNSSFFKRLMILPELHKLEDKPFGTYDTVYYSNIYPQDLAFAGNLYVLINGQSISTTGLVCNSLRKHRGALFIGEPGGFTPQGTFGQPLPFTLPNSKITGFISTIRFNSNADFFIGKEPFIPDIIVSKTIEDLINNRDPVLEKTLIIIRKKYSH
jgi:hypothetical protein